MPKHALGTHNKRISGTLLFRFKAYKAESGGISLRCGTPRTLSSMPMTLLSMPRSAKDVAKHA